MAGHPARAAALLQMNSGSYWLTAAATSVFHLPFPFREPWAVSESKSMSTDTSSKPNRGSWMALTAAFLGWMFDGMEMGIFPLVARPA